MCGSINSQGSDYLIIAVGYDHKLVSEVTNGKDNLKVYPLFLVPSFSKTKDFYQQSAIRASATGAVVLDEEALDIKSSFARQTIHLRRAGVLSDIVKEIYREINPQIIYLSLFQLKVQALGLRGSIGA